MDRYSPLFAPKELIRITSREEVGKVAPDAAGLYGFWFAAGTLPQIPRTGCVTRDGFAMLNLGIAKNNKTCTSNLRKRLTNHFGGRGGVTPLRKKLELLTGLAGDDLTAWLQDNARLSWVEVPEPYKENRALIRQGVFPLNG